MLPRSATRVTARQRALDDLEHRGVLVRAEVRRERGVRAVGATHEREGALDRLELEAVEDDAVVGTGPARSADVPAAVVVDAAVGPGVGGVVALLDLRGERVQRDGARDGAAAAQVEPPDLVVAEDGGRPDLGALLEVDVEGGRRRPPRCPPPTRGRGSASHRRTNPPLSTTFPRTSSSRGRRSTRRRSPRRASWGRGEGQDVVPARRHGARLAGGQGLALRHHRGRGGGDELHRAGRSRGERHPRGDVAGVTGFTRREGGSPVPVVTASASAAAPAAATRRVI